MSRVVDELRSGKCSIYAQWLAVLSLLFLVVLPFMYLANSGLLFVWSVMSWVMAVLVTLTEFPLFSRCLPVDSGAARLFASSRYYLFRAASYLLFAAVLWLSAVDRTSVFLLPAASLTASSLLYAVSVWRREDAEESIIKGADVA